MSRKLALPIIFLAATFISLSGAAAAEKVSFTLNWSADPGHAPYFYGQKLGHYKDADLAVTIFQGRGSGNTSQVVAAGQSDFGIADTATAIKLAARGAPLKIVGIVEHVSNWAIIVKEDSPIKAPKDLEGKKFGVSSGTAIRALFDAVANANGVDVSKVELVNYDSAASLSMLSEGRVDAIIDVPDIMKPRLDARGVPSRAIFLRDHGVPLFGISVIATEETIEKRPDVVRKFLEATAKSLRATIKDPKAAANALLTRFPDAGKPEAVLYTLEQRSKGSFCAPDSIGILHPSEANLKGAYDTMTAYLNVDKSQPIDFYYRGHLLPKKPVGCP